MLGYVFDDTVLTALGGGDHVMGSLLASLHGRDIRVCVPAGTLAYAFAALPNGACVELFGIVEAMDNTAVDPLTDTEAALELAEFVELMPDDAAAAHALTAARRHGMEVVTLDRSRWRALEQRLPYPLPLVDLLDENP